MHRCPSVRSGWGPDIRTGFLHELSDCSANAGIAVRGACLGFCTARWCASWHGSRFSKFSGDDYLNRCWTARSALDQPSSSIMKEASMVSEQKVAVITGASGGIGATLVKAYRDLNYRVVATARSMEPLIGNDVVVVAGDIADRKTAERASSEGMARFGRIDTLINNAGIFISKPFTQYTEADYAAILGVNVTGFFHITQLAIAEMEKRGSGHIVQITASLVDHAIAGVPAALAVLTKGGLNAATKSLESSMP